MSHITVCILMVVQGGKGDEVLLTQSHILHRQSQRGLSNQECFGFHPVVEYRHPNDLMDQDSKIPCLQMKLYCSPLKAGRNRNPITSTQNSPLESTTTTKSTFTTSAIFTITTTTEGRATTRWTIILIFFTITSLGARG